MTFTRYDRLAMCILVSIPWVGCVKAPIRRQEKPPEQTGQIKNDLVSHLEGTWEYSGGHGPSRQLIFAGDGRLTFQGGLEFFNPGQWDLDAARRELHLTLPAAADEKLQIFQLEVGDGVKAFDPANKRITYTFDIETWTLNVGGWPYAKADKPAVRTDQEPVLK